MTVRQSVPKDLSKKHSSYEWGVWWMILSATCLSISFLFLKINLSYINYFFLLFLRFFIPFLIVISIILLRSRWQVLKILPRFSIQLLRCTCILVSQYAIAFYLTQNTLLNATVLLNASPLFVPLLEWIFLGHPPGKSTMIGALLAFFGVILVLQPDSSLFSSLSAIGLLAALGQAGSQVLFGLKGKKENVLSNLFYLFLFTSLFSGIFLLGRLYFGIDKESAQQIENLNWIIYLNLLFMAVGTLFNQYFRGLAYRCARPSTLATFLYFSVLVSFLFDWLIFKNFPTMLSIVGGCLIILGGILKIFLRARILKKKQK